MRKFITTLCLVASATLASADAVSIIEENDIFNLLHKNDNQYTQGAQITYTHASIDSNGVPFREVYGLSQKIYTPDNTFANYNQYNDRPYCATLTGEYEYWSKGSLFNHETTRQIFEVGVLGPAAYGEQAQNGVHKLIRNDLTTGWQYQLKNEPVINYYNERYTTVYDVKNGKWEFNAEAIYGGTIGTEFVNTFAGTKFMFGYNLPQYKILGGIYPKDIKNGVIESETGWFYYGFFQEKAMAVAQDTTLGNSFIYGQESGVHPCPAVNEILYGLTAGWNWISLSYAIGVRSSQFEGEKGPFDWGQIILTVGTTF